MNTLLLRSLLPAIVLLLSTLQASAAELGQPVRANGMELFYGVMPAEIIRGHPILARTASKSTCGVTAT